MTKTHDHFSYPPRGMSRDEAARYIGVGSTKFDQLVADGRLPKAIHIDARVIWDRIALDQAFTELAHAPVNEIDEILNRAARRKSRAMPPLSSKPEVTDAKGLAKRWLCSERHVHNLVKRGDLPAIKHMGKLLRIRWVDIEAFEKSGGSKAPKSE